VAIASSRRRYEVQIFTMPADDRLQFLRALASLNQNI
jgi:hypothetical protein